MPSLPISGSRRAAVLILSVAAALCFHSALAEEQTVTPPPNEPKIAPASSEGEQALNGFRIPKGMTGSLFAAEPLLANPVAFCIDEQGRFYVCETFRQSKGVEDNRSHMHWLHDDLAARTVEDRLAYFKKHLGDKVQEYTREDDRIRLLEDTDGDGRADKSTVFASGFNAIVEGTGAGVLAHRGNVYYTNIPNVWRLRDDDGDGKSDRRESLSSGYGVRVAFRGHDLHGLTLGPDGRLYFSIGDRGYNLTTKEGRHLARPDTGAVFRCELDGSNLEVFAYGLRNPQELAFDDEGNLFTVDNNSDSGDKARLTYIPEGADIGWRMYYQYLSDRGPWNRERIWHPYRNDEDTARVQPAYIVPPIVNLSDGPSGLVYYPGVGLPDRYKGHFFLADFRGTPGNSGIRSFGVKPKGASFELTDSHEFLWSILATDLDFGYDGALYVSDWVTGWEGIGKGRIYRFTHDDAAKQPEIAESAKLMREGFEHRPVDELLGLLSHVDRRVRLGAQLALPTSTTTDIEDKLGTFAAGSIHEFAPLHAVWALGQIARSDRPNSGESLQILLSLAAQTAPSVQAQALRMTADAVPNFKRENGNLWHDGGGYMADVDKGLAEMLTKKDDRVKCYAALALGKLGAKSGVEPLFGLLDTNKDNDPVLRHAAVMGLAGIGDVEQLVAAAKHPSRSVRLGALLALRRLERPEIAEFLKDDAAALVLEAARAINDVPIEAAQPQLAALAGTPGMSDALLRRVISANFRIGGREQAEAVAAIAADDRAPEPVRLEAIAALKDWNSPPPLDRVLGMWRPLDARSTEGLADVVRPALGGILSGSDKIRQAGVQLAAQYGVKEVGPALFEMLSEAKRPADVRVEAIKALDKLGDARLSEATELALAADSPLLRAEGRRLLVKLHPEKAVEVLSQALDAGSTVERQSAITVLESLKSADADALLAKWLDRLIAGEAPAEIHLDLLEAAARRGTPELKDRIAQHDAARPAADPLAPYREALAGGHTGRGYDVFFGRSAVSCRRCHKVGDDGGEVGPDLSKIGTEKTREYLLEAIVLPNKQIAKGFETVVLALVDGTVQIGVVRQDDGQHLQLMTADGSLVTVAKEDIEDQATGKSSMPEDLIKQLSKSDVRDLIEYLIAQKGGKDTAAHGESSTADAKAQ